MFKQIMVLIRGQAHMTEQGFADRHAIPILSQQIREAARGVEAARKAVAVAIAQNRIEKDNADRLTAQIADLEQRAIAALAAGKDALAREAAQSLAHLEGELDSSRSAGHAFEADIDRLKQALRQSERRLAALQRGERLAVARDRTQRLTHDVARSDLSSLTDAEATLARLENRQKVIDITADAIDNLRADKNPHVILRKLAEAGCGAPTIITADAVMARLRGKMASTQ